MTENDRIPPKVYPFQDQKPLKFNWDKPLRETPVFYQFLMPIAKIVLKVPFKAGFEAYGAENMPTSGPFLICANHVKGIDPISTVYASHGKRTLYFMSKEEFFHTFYIKYVLEFFHGFPIRHDKIDRDSLNFASRCLKEGFGVMIFPEGTRDKKHNRPVVENGKPGTAMIARDNKVPVLPASIHVIDYPDGTSKCIVRIGELIPFEDLGFTPDKKRSKELKAATTLIMERIVELWDKDA